MTGQDRAQLEAKRQNLLKRIEETNALISQSRKRQQAAVADLQTLKTEISLRKDVIATLDSEVRIVEEDIARKRSALQSLEKETADLLSEHARELRKAYIQKRMEHPFVFLISSKDLNDAFFRWRYLRAVRISREKLYARILVHQDSIVRELRELEQLQTEKTRLLDDVQGQKSKLTQNINSSESMIKSLRQKEQQLLTELERQKKESARLAGEIERIIRAEMAKSTEAEATGLPGAPAFRALTADFSRNKGNLPWPVDRGMITGKFGEQPHPVLSSIKIANNGVDITAPKGAPVHAIFDGKVVGMKIIPGYDHIVIIQHGAYYSVYSRLANVRVSIGDQVTTGTRVGSLASTHASHPKLHLEIWEGKTQQDPELWISR